MPIYIIDKEEKLTYTPDQQETRGLSAELETAVRVLVQDASAVGIEIPTALTLALMELERPDREHDAVFEYRRLPGNVRIGIVQRHTVNGLTDFWSARWEMGKEALIGWRNVLGADGHDVPFDKALIPMIPGSIVTDIGVLIDEKSPEMYLKNSGVTLNGTSP